MKAGCSPSYLTPALSSSRQSSVDFDTRLQQQENTPPLMIHSTQGAATRGVLGCVEGLLPAEATPLHKDRWLLCQGKVCSVLLEWEHEQATGGEGQDA